MNDRKPTESVPLSGLLEIEESSRPNPDYIAGLFRLNGVVIGSALRTKAQEGWTIHGGRKARPARQTAVEMLKQNLRDAQERQRTAARDEQIARTLLRSMQSSPETTTEIRPS